jgi:DNA-binding HxlR family transcriptional regulator
LILRELMLGSHRFGELQRGLPRISRNLLSQRLAWLERAGLVIRTPRPDGRGGDYTLTEAGMQFWPVVQALGAWGHRWATRDVRSADLDPCLLMWFLRRRIRSANLPPRKLVVRFEFPGQSPGMFWLILQRSGTDLRDADPGVRVDLWVTADLAALAAAIIAVLLDRAWMAHRRVRARAA